jgi:4-hydroxy-tetrahydrodipicolinate synthase
MTDCDAILSQRHRRVCDPAFEPFDRELSLDSGRFAAHCRWLVDAGANGLAVLGTTTSEANSLSAGERVAALD